MTISDFIRKDYKQGAEYLLSEGVELGFTKQQIIGVAAKLRQKGLKVPYFTDTTTPVSKSLKSNSHGAISVDDFVKENDIFLFVINAAKTIPIDVMYKEADFIKKFLMGKSNYRAALESESMKDYRGRAGGVYYIANPKDIKDLKARGLLY